MDFVVSPSCHEIGLRAGAILFRDVHVTPAFPELRGEISHAAETIRQQYPITAAIRDIPEVIAVQEILRKVGIKPKKEQPSVERLIGFALKRGELPAINSLVDAYNLVSIRTLCSLGAHDLDTIALPVAL